MGMSKRVCEFNLRPGRMLTRKYEVTELLGQGWEGEVYKIVERSTGIERAAKMFYPHRNPGDRTAKLYARKLHRLRHCPVIIQYYTREEIHYKRTPITVLISEYVDGERLSDFINRQRGKRVTPFEAVHLLHSLASGIEQIHQLREYHGDLHTDNIIVNHFGLGFELKLIDFYHWSSPKSESIQTDITDMIRVFYDVLGGSRHYPKHNERIKKICCGLKTGLILKKFPTASRLKDHLESMVW